MNIVDLPLEVIHRIFLDLPVEQWLSLSHVCKHWAKAIGTVWNRADILDITYSSVRLTIGERVFKMIVGEHCRDSLMQLITCCGPFIKALVLRTSAFEEFPLDLETARHIRSCCRNLKCLRLNGCISHLSVAIIDIADDLDQLDELTISHYENCYSKAPGTLPLLERFVARCDLLRNIEVDWEYGAAPSSDSVVYRRLPELTSLIRLTWLMKEPVQASVLDSLLRCLAGCRALRVLHLFCTIFNEELEHSTTLLRQLTLGDDLEELSIGFQLVDGDVAPWTNDVLERLLLLTRLRHLKLRNFNLSGDTSLTKLAQLTARLDVLQLDDNYDVGSQLVYALRNSLTNVRKVYIDQAVMSHADLVYLVWRCPNLESLIISNVYDASFKNLVLDVYWQMRHARRSRPLYLQLRTARSFIHEEAKQLQHVHLTGLQVLPPGAAQVIIDNNINDNENQALEVKVGQQPLTDTCCD